MAKFKSVIVACLLILMSVLFVACGQSQIESISFKEKDIYMTVGDSYNLELEYSPKDAELEIEYSVSDNTVVYVVPNTNTVVALKAGSAVVYAKAQNGKTASINVQVVETKQNLTAPSNLKLDRENNKLTWIAVPAAYQYQVEITFDGNTTTKVVSNNYLEIAEIENLVLKPGKVVTFRVKAIASNSSAYQNSDWSDVLTFDELIAVENLSYDLSNGTINFEYELAKQVSNGNGIYFQINITGADNKTIRILKNETGVYSQSYRPTKAGEYTISVVAMMSGKTTSIAKVIKLNKLEKVTFEQDKTSIISKWKDGEQDYRINLSISIDGQSQNLTSQNEALIADNIALISDKTANLTSYVEKINKEETINGVKTYYINSDISVITLGKAITPTNLQIEKISDSSVKLIWVYGGNTYKVYLNGEPVDCEQNIITKNSVQYVEVVLDNLNAAGEYQFQVTSQKENTNTNFYLDSDAANFKKIVKFGAAKTKFNSDLKRIEYELNANQVGGNIELTIKNGNTTNITESISAITGSVEVEVANIGEYKIEVRITKTEDNAVYLSADTQIITIIKLSAVDYETELSTNEDEMTITFVKKSNASGYKILLNGEEISDLPNSENIYRTRIDDVTINNKNYGKFTLKNINVAGKYVLNIVALGSDDENNDNYILSSNDSSYEFYKLASPTLNYYKVDSKIINFTWNVVNGSNVTYEIKVIKVATGEIIYNMPVSTTSHNITFDNEGEYVVTVIAKSSRDNYLKSNVNIEACNVTIIKLNMLQDVKHEIKTDSFTNERLSVVSSNKVDNADGYILILEKISNGSNVEIARYNSYVIDGDKVVFTLGNVDSVFADAGQYNFKFYATSSQSNILQSEVVGYRVNKLSSPENVTIEYNENSTVLRFASQDSQGRFLISVDGGSYVEINQNHFDISNLNAGSHEFKIINLGNGKNILNSNVTTVTLRILVRLNTPANIQIGVDPNDDSKILVSFDKVENASYYEIVISQNSDKIITYRPTSIENRYVVEISRSEFCEGLQNLSIIAKPADGSEQYEMSFTSSKIYIEKAVAVDKVLLSEDGKLNLHEKQALINGKLYSNLLTDVPELSSGEKLTFVVRNISTIVDGFDSENKFHMAGEWSQVELTRLSTPNITLNSDSVKIDYVREGVDYNLILTLDYLGLNSASVLQTFTFNLTNELGENATVFDIKSFITNFVSLTNLVGDYRFAVLAKPMSNENLKLYISSKNSIEINYKYVENIENNNAIFNQENSGKINLKINKNYLEKINKIYFEIVQNSKKCIFEINLENNLINILKNELNSVEINLIKNISENEIEFSVDIYKLINAGEISVNWSLKGDEEYYISPSNLEVENITKLNQPEFSYVADILGNKIVLTNETISAMPNATFVAVYNSERLEFSKTAEGVYLYLPYEWTILADIEIYALTNETGFINSDEVVVNFKRANSIENLHLTEDSLTDKTYIEWSSDAAEFIIYISQDNFQTIKVYSSTNARFEITDEMLSAGNVRIRVVVKGYTSGSEIYLNSDFVELVCEKLDNQAVITNPNGVLTWSVFAQESLLKQYRINIGGNIYNFEPSVHTFGLKDLSGYITLNFKLVGDPTQNIISSNYQIVYVYKFNKPNSFKIQNGKFIIDENLENIDINLDNLDFLIDINSNSFLYSEYVNYSDEMVEKFYQLLASNNGLASANYVVQTGTVVNKDGKKYLAVNSDKTDEKSFGIYQIDIENDEFYLTQTKLISGNIETYFNWEWVDATFAQEGTVRIILKPKFTTMTEIYDDGWRTIKTKSGEVAVYYIDITFNNLTSGGNYVSSAVCLKLPSSLEAAEYTIQVQKTSLSGNINLSSQNVDVLNFTKLLKPATVIKNGKIVWTQDGNAAYYQMLYVNSGVSTWSENLLNGSFEPNSLFESLTSQNKFSFKMVAFGNVTELKPAENLSALSKNYIIASDFGEGEFTKLRQPGDLVLINGVIYWKNSNTYDYYKVENVDSKIELRFYDLAMNELTSAILPAKALINDDSIKFIDDYLTDAQKNILKASGKIIIKYRQLGSTFDNYINSEFKNLKIEGAQSTIIGGEILNYFEFLNRALDISLTEANGLTFTGVTYDNSLLSKIYYDVYFVLGKGKNAVTILATTLENSTNITFSELKNLLKAKDPTAIISQIFVVARGNNTYYISSLKSAIKNVYTIQGEATMIIENGIIKWENIENAGSYQIKSIVNGEEYIYEIKYINNRFTINGETTNAVYFETQASGKLMWCFNIAAYDKIADAEHSLNIRYMPTNQGSDVFAIPGEWTANAIRVYKISKPNVRLEKGVFVWDIVTNAESFRVTIKDQNDNEILTYLSNATSYLLDLNELAVKLGKDVDAVINEISSYKITFQSVGPNASVNGVYFISSVEVEQTGLTLKANTIGNIQINQDTLTWTDTSDDNEYIIYITGEDNGVKVLKTITTTEKSYDLSLAKLNGDNDAVYSVTIKIAGDNVELASAVSKQVDFKVLHSISSISLNNGYVNFEVQEGATSYTVTFEIASFVYNYVIKKVGNNYQIERVTQVSNGSVIELDKGLETDMYYENGKIYLWPVNVTMYTSATVSVKANGYKQDETTYISSFAKTYGTVIFKPDTSKAARGKVTYDSKLDQTTFTWTTGMSFSFGINIKLYKVVNGVRTEINLNNAQKFNNKLILNGKLEKGDYEVVIQIVPKENNYYLKSEWKTLKFAFNG